MVINLNTIPFLPSSWVFSPWQGGKTLSLKTTPGTSQALVLHGSEQPVISLWSLVVWGFWHHWGWRDLAQKCLLWGIAQATFSLSQPTVKEACIPVTLLYLGQNLLEEKCPNWVYNHVLSTYFHQQSLEFSLLCWGLVAPLQQNVTFSGVFLIHPEYLEPVHLFLKQLFCVQHPDFHWPGSSSLPQILSMVPWCLGRSIKWVAV